MQTQTLEHTTKWQEVRAEWVRKLRDGKTPEKAEDYASWFTRCQGLKEGFDVPSHNGKPECGYYAVQSINKTRWCTCCYQRDEKGTIVCLLDGGLRHPKEMKLEKWEEMWTRAVKKPLEYADYKHLKDTGRLPGESEAAAADRGNVVSINAGNGATLVPTARTDESMVTTTHNQPPEAVADTYEGLLNQFELLKISAENRIKQGAAKTKEEADQATDDAERLLKIGKKADGKYKEEYEPLDQKVRVLRVKWNILRTEPDELKKQLKTRVVTPWLKAEDDKQKAEVARLRAEYDAANAAGATPTAPPPSTKPTTGSGLGRQSSLRTNSKCKLNNRVPFILYLIEHSGQGRQEIDEVLQKFGDAYARAKTDPVPPGIEYVEEQTAV